MAGRDGSLVWYFSRYFVHNEAAINKVVGYLVEAQNSTTLSDEFVLIQYYWSGSDGKPKLPEKFVVKTERREKTVIKALKDAAQEPAAGRALAPSVIFNQVMNSVRPEDRLVNLFMTPKNRRQVTNAKQVAKRELFGPDDLSFSMNHPNVEFKNIVTNNGSELVFFLGQTYQKNLFRAAGLQKYHIKVNLDSSYNFCGRFITSVVQEHPFLKKREGGGPALMMGPVFVTLCITAAAYRHFAQYLRSCLTAEDLRLVVSIAVVSRAVVSRAVVSSANVSSASVSSAKIKYQKSC